MALKIKVKQGTSAPATGALDTAELGYNTAADKLYVGNGAGVAATGISMDGHTHAISDTTGLQTALDGKQATITGAASTVTSSNLTASRVIISDASGKIATNTVTTTTLGYLDATSSIQTQLNGKAATSHTHTLANITDSGAAAGYGVTDSSSASALGTGTSLTTERDVYYGTPTINGSKAYNSSSNIYAPTTVGAAGQVAVSTGSGAPSYQYRGRAFFLASNFTNSTTTLNAVTGLTFTMEAGKKYHIRFLGTYEAAASTTGCMFGINLSAGAATVRGYAQGEITAATLASGLRSAIYQVTTAQPAGSYITTTGTSAPSTYQSLEMDVVVQCSTAGAIRVTFATEVAGSTATLHAGSAMIVDELSV